MAKKENPIIVFTTVAKKSQAKKIAKSLLDQKLAACITTLPQGESHYRWQEKTCVEKEFLLMIKTLSSRWPPLEKFLKRIHPYECPEIIAVPTKYLHPPYKRWLSKQLKKG
jgi:periplasmic divalent cation tolerance protein